MKLKVVDVIYCATCGYNINFYPHYNCERVGLGLKEEEE